jgi:tetratricopeptide (TPR) repeat protein
VWKRTAAKKLRWLGAALLVGLLGFPEAQAAQVTANGSDNALPFENEGGTARAAAMGSAGVAIAKDASALEWNPAGLSALTSPEIGLHHDTWIDGVVQETLLYAMPLGAWGGGGLGLDYSDWGTFETRDNFGAVTGSFQDMDLGLVAGWGRTVLPKLAMGLGMEGLQETLAGQGFASMAARAGLLWNPLAGLDLGGSLQMGISQARRNGVDPAFQLGGAWTQPLPGSRLLVSAGYTYAGAGASRLPIGLELAYRELIFARLGYLANLYDNQWRGYQGLSSGVGFAWQGWSLDYAFQPFGDLGNSQRISLAWRFGTAPEDLPHLEVLRREGNQLLLEGQYTQAILRFKAMLESDPENASAWRGLGNGYYRLQDKAGAVNAFERSLQTDPAFRDLRERLEAYKSAPDAAYGPALAEKMRAEARGLVLARRYDEAVEAYKVALHLDKNSAAAWQGLGNAYYLTGQKALAVKAFQTSLQLDPSNQDLRDKLNKYLAR